METCQSSQNDVSKYLPSDHKHKLPEILITILLLYHHTATVTVSITAVCEYSVRGMSGVKMAVHLDVSDKNSAVKSCDASYLHLTATTKKNKPLTIQLELISNSIS